MNEVKPYNISKRAVVTAYERVKANKGTYGIDKQSIEDFEKKLKNNLYKIWNRCPQAVIYLNQLKQFPYPRKMVVHVYLEY